jgi:superfamily II DNA or RNA helicase
MTARTYGALKYNEGYWYMKLAPHVAIRVKRMFPRVQQARTGIISIKDTPEVGRDLEWLLERHPLQVDDVSMTRLTQRAGEHRATERAVESIMIGGGPALLGGFQEPGRPGREYQTQAADLVWRTGRLLLGDDVGLGKTQSALMLLRDPATLPALVVTLTHLPMQWLRELQVVMPWLTGHIATKRTPYDVDADVLIMNYAKMTHWVDHLAGEVRTVIFDEVQELRRHESMKYTAAAQIADKADWKLGLSATPVFNYGGEIHSIMHVLAPGQLGTREEFIREWGAGERNNNVTVAQPKALGQYLRDEGLMLRRTRKDVHRELPDPISITHEVPSDPGAFDKVKNDVRAMAQLILNTDTDKTDRWRASGELDWKMRQATGIAKAPYVAEFVRLLLESEESVLLAGWHRAVYDIWRDLLREFNPVLYTGTESPIEKQTAADKFMTGASRVMLMSLRAGAGLDGLQNRCSVAVIGELDWSPEVHKQFIGRLARDGQESTVAAYYLVTDAGSDPVISDVLQLKRQQAEPIRDPDAPLYQQAVDTSDRIRRLAQAALERGAP